MEVMTQQYQQESINEQDNPSSLEIDSLDSRNVSALVPPGTTATMQRPLIPGILALSALSYAGVIAPGVGESVTLRIFRIRPSSNPEGFGFILLNDPFTIDLANFAGAGNEFIFSDSIIPNRCVLPHEYLAISWVHAGVAVMEPLNMNWTFRPVGVAEPEPAATFSLAQYAQVFG